MKCRPMKIQLPASSALSLLALALPLPAAETVLVADAPATALVPTAANGGSDLSVADWATVTSPSNAANWSAGTTGVGYEANPGSGTSYAGLLGLDLQDVMEDINATAYIRVPFTIDQSTLNSAQGLFLDMKYDDAGNVSMEYRIPTRGLIGFTSFFLRTTRGNGVKSSVFIGYEPMKGEIKSTATGVLVAHEPGVAVTYGLLNAQGRGDTFIDPGSLVYEGMIVGMHRREGDIPINVCKEKKLTNMRSSTADVTKRLNATVRFSLEDALDSRAKGSDGSHDTRGALADRRGVHFAKHRYLGGKHAAGAAVLSSLSGEKGEEGHGRQGRATAPPGDLC